MEGKELKKQNLDTVDFYNSSYKKLFIYDIMNQNTKANLSNFNTLFKITSELENMHTKDLYLFSLKEIYEVISKIGKTSKGVVYTYTSHIKHYMEFAMKDKRITSNILDDIPVNDLIRNSGCVLKVPFITRRMIYEELIPKLRNAQDKAYVVLLFENIACSLDELANLKCKHVDYSNKTITILRNDKLKIVKVSDEILDFVFKASEEIEYKPNTLEAPNLKKKADPQEINDFVFRSKSTFNTGNIPVTKGTFQGRANKMSDYLMKKYMSKMLSNCLSPKVLTYSGMYEKLLKKTLEPTWKDFVSVTKEYTANQPKSINAIQENFNLIKDNPIFKTNYEKLFTSRDIVPEINDEKWVLDKSETGLWGECFILKCLQKALGTTNAKKVKARNGYDLEVFEKVGLEVKTSVSEEVCSFHISITELKKAEILKNQYFLALVEKDNEDVNHVKIIQNPIKALNIDMGLINQLYGSNTSPCIIKQSNFYIRLNHENIKYLNFEEFINIVTPKTYHQ
jgi:integrase